MPIPYFAPPPAPAPNPTTNPITNPNSTPYPGFAQGQGESLGQYWASVVAQTNPSNPYSNMPSNLQPVNTGYVSQFTPQGLFNIPQTDTTSAAQTYANIAQENYTNYQNLYQPLTSYLNNMVNNQGYQQQQVGLNVQSYNQQANMAQEAFQQNLGRMGVKLTPEQQAAYDRYTNLQNSLGRMQAANSTALGVQSIGTQVLGATGLPSSVSTFMNSPALTGVTLE